MVVTETNPCFFCESTVGPKHKHHLLPQKFNVYFKKTNDESIFLCPSCHAKLHQVIKPLESVITKALNKNTQLRDEILNPWIEQQGFEIALERFKEAKIRV